VGAGMAVRTHDGQARQRQPDHVQNALILAAEIEQLTPTAKAPRRISRSSRPPFVLLSVCRQDRSRSNDRASRRSARVAHGKTALGEAGKARPGLKVMEQMAVDGEQGHSAPSSATTCCDQILSTGGWHVLETRSSVRRYRLCNEAVGIGQIQIDFCTGHRGIERRQDLESVLRSGLADAAVGENIALDLSMIAT